jgi:hypothetical protein
MAERAPARLFWPLRNLHAMRAKHKPPVRDCSQARLSYRAQEKGPELYWSVLERIDPEHLEKTTFELALLSVLTS